MTIETKDQPKTTPAYYIFEKGADGNNTRVGAAFKHGKGTGFNVLIGDKRYTAFEPKAKS